MMRTSPLTRTDQKFLSRALSSLWNDMPVDAAFICRSKAVVFTAFCSSPVRRARESVKVSAIEQQFGELSRCDANAAFPFGAMQYLLVTRARGVERHRRYVEPRLTKHVDRRKRHVFIRKQTHEYSYAAPRLTTWIASSCVTSAAYANTARRPSGVNCG